MSQFFQVKNFDRFQHYKDRSPPWIKLYNELLDDYEFGCLQDASKMHLIAIWLLASRSDNRLPYDTAWIAKRINATEPVNLDALVHAGFIIVIQDDATVKQDASAPQAKRLTRERDTNLPETEGEKREKLARSPRERVFQKLGSPDGFYEEGEFNNLALRFPDADLESRLVSYWPWGVRQQFKPHEIKAAFFSTLEKEAGATKLIGERATKPDVVVSSQLAASKLARRTMDDAGPIPKELDRRKQAQGAAA